ncbi:MULTISPECIES: Rv3654c family TadE-like protein [unclassified Streptomyces]|uniref:Rv3654c family TadE-like protein n=1 Tax=unclassified Streptomyces TaxID=2593676 RepID=UPI003423CFAB
MWSPVWSDCRARWRAWWRARRHAWWRASSDRGSATVWAVGAIAVLCAVFGAVLSMGQAVVVRHRAAGAADLAALAAADHWSDGGAAACASAERVAQAQRARLVRCAVEGQISDVTAVSGTGPITAEVRSRAGPPELAETPASEAPRGFRPSGSSNRPSHPGRPSSRPWPPRTQHSPVRP